MTPPPKLRAEFVVDPTGEPMAVPGKTATHYKIRLFVEGAPASTTRVTYTLHESYRQPVRDVPFGVKDFEEQITSYGNYTVKATVRTREGVRLLSIDLAEALREHYASARAGSRVEEAIAAIAER